MKLDTKGFESEFGFAPNEHQIRIANNCDPYDEALPYDPVKYRGKTAEEYRQTWLRKGKKATLDTQPVVTYDIPCRHRGNNVVRVGACDLCGIKGQPFDVLPCEIHGECSLARRHSKVQSCVSCQDFSEREPPTKRLTIGMATRQDSLRTRWTVRCLQQMHAAELAVAGITWEIVLIDNGTPDELAPNGRPHSEHLQGLAKQSDGLVRYVAFTGEQGTFPPKAAVFDHAHGEIVVVIDCHVMLALGSLKRLVEWFASHPDFSGIAHGPILRDGGQLLYTHEEREYRANMLAMWDNYVTPTEHCTVANPPGEFGEREVEIPQAGAWQFACRRDAWPSDSLPKGLRGFGGDENIDRLFQSLGRKSLCLEWFAGWHDFYKTMQNYINDPFNRLRNDCLWHVACGDTYRIVEAMGHYQVDEQKKLEILIELGLTPMSELDNLYRAAVNQPSDIRAHVPRLRALAEQCRTVVEFGTRYGISTTAFAASGVEVVTYDVRTTKQSASLIEIAPNVRQVIADTTTLEDIPDCDLLFIDTLHREKQVSAELRYADRVKRFIVFHDTVTFGEVGDDHGPGTMFAIRDFLAAHPEWGIREQYADDNGLLVLERGIKPATATQPRKIPRLTLKRKEVLA